MATPRSLSGTPTASTASDASVPSARGPHGSRHRLRAVGRDEVVEIADLLPPGATWLPAPPHVLPALPGRPPMVGYLVLVPAGQQPPFAVPAGQQQPFTPTAVPVEPESPAPAGAAAGTPERDARYGDPLVRIDPVRRTAEVGGRELDLTYLEFELLAHLVAHPHRVHTRDRLVTTVWGYGHVGDGRTVDVHIARLRRKLGAEHRAAIQTVRRVGYKYTPPTVA
jgi:hypothetical protein